MSFPTDWLKTLETDVESLRRSLADLDQQVMRLRETGAADRERAHGLLDEAFGHAGKARGAIEALARSSGLPVPVGMLKAGRELSSKVAAMREGPRRLLRSLADELDAGSVRHQRPAKQKALDAARLEAVAALRSAADSDLPPPLPAAAGPSWLAWWWGMPGEKQDELMAQLEAVPALPALLDDLSPDNW
ncbi:MAG: hypothetical protein K2W96_27930, partial [Gemmataceae bacterium]|nr:hypothetical protein [Gemmataceae bacterium]